jgi:hypothetical protein
VRSEERIRIGGGDNFEDRRAKSWHNALQEIQTFVFLHFTV